VVCLCWSNQLKSVFGGNRMSLMRRRGWPHMQPASLHLKEVAKRGVSKIGHSVALAPPFYGLPAVHLGMPRKSAHFSRRSGNVPATVGAAQRNFSQIQLGCRCAGRSRPKGRRLSSCPAAVYRPSFRRPRPAGRGNGPILHEAEGQPTTDR
jgi:hypothetical protein